MCSGLRAILAAVVLVAAFGGAPAARAYDYTVISSTFDTGGEGWSLAGTGTLEWLPYGWLRLTDSGAGDLTLVAPTTFRGDLSVFDGGTIWFAAYAEQGCPDADACGTVTISGPAGSASRDLIPGPPSPDWWGFAYYVAPLTPEAWGVTAGMWTALLANVTDIRILLDCGGEGEVLLFDEFTLASAPAGLFPLNPNCALYDDEPGDTFIRRTSQDILPVNPNAHIDLLQYRMGNWMPDDPNAPYDPNADLFTGAFDAVNGPYLRFDMLFDGLVNPAGPEQVGNYNPLVHGNNPLLGVVEIEVDLSGNTGGELARAQDYFLGNAGRFGFKARYAPNRSAELFGQTQMAFDNNPQVKWTGMDFELFFGGQPITQIEKRVGNQNNTFEAGETWVVTGRFFCRARGYEFGPFWDGLGTDGVYCPEVKIMFSHNNDPMVNKTSVSLLFPLINFTEPEDFNDDNEVSVLEALNGLVAAHHSTFHSEDAVIADWACQTPIIYLGVMGWSVKLMTSTAYNTSTPPSDGQNFVWTDYAPNQVPGDLNGDGVVDTADRQLFNARLAFYDDPNNPFHSDYDAGPAGDGVVIIPNYPRNFSFCDRNYDGVINAPDDPLTPLRPADLNGDGVVDAADFVLFATAMAGPKITAPPSGCGIGLFSKADFDADADVDLIDFARFQLAFGGSK